MNEKPDHLSADSTTPDRSKDHQPAISRPWRKVASAWALSWGALLLGHTLARLLFLAANREKFANSPTPETALSVLFGIRFDLAFLATSMGLTVPFLTLTGWLSPKAKRWWMARWVMGLTVINSIGMMFDIGDVVFYSFSGRRSTYSQLSLALNDWQEILRTSLQYPVFWAILLALWAGCYFCSRSFVRSFSFLPGMPARSIASLLAAHVAFVFLCGRGGTQVKPIATTHAYVFSQPQLGDLALSTAFSITRTVGDEPLPQTRYFSSWDEVTARLPDPVPVRDQQTRRKPLNFMLIIWESLSAEYTRTMAGGTSYTPFLDSLLPRSLWFPNAYANGRRSIESSTSLLFGIPALMNEALIQSPYAGGMRGLPAMLSTAGYSSAFFHGGARGSMFFDVMAKIAGYSLHRGKEDFPDRASDDGSWGIFDGPFFQWTVHEITKLKPPFFTTLFTLSSHSPYTIPPAWQGRLPKGTLPIHESIGYTDAMLREFFDQASRQPWFQDTVFFITGDHTSVTALKDFNVLLPFRVPMIVYSPGGQIPPGKSLRIVQHADVMPTVVDLAGVAPLQLPRFGQSMLSQAGGGQAINRMGETFWLLRPELLLVLEPDKPAEISTPPGDYMQVPRRKGDEAEAIEALKAQIQYFTEGMTLRKIYPSLPQGRSISPQHHQHH